MDDRQLALKYAPILHFDVAETIPLQKVGFTVFREEMPSDSFPRRIIRPDFCALVIEYALYWDYDIQHMYDLEHIWVHVAADGRVTRAEGSFHGRYLTLWTPELPCARALTQTHVHAFCQPGKHAFLPDGQLFRLLPDWETCCQAEAGGGVLVGGPFHGEVHSTPEEDARCAAQLRAKYAFSPSLTFDRGTPVSEDLLCSWEALKSWIPGRIAALCQHLGETP